MNNCTPRRPKQKSIIMSAEDGEKLGEVFERSGISELQDLLYQKYGYPPETPKFSGLWLGLPARAPDRRRQTGSF